MTRIGIALRERSLSLAMRKTVHDLMQCPEAYRYISEASQVVFPIFTIPFDSCI